MRGTFAWWTALPMLLAVPAVANAQSVPAAPVPSADATQQPTVVEFSADQEIYDSQADVVTASGAVRMNREGNYLAADQVVWDRKSGQVHAQGNVVVLTPEGDKLIGENVQLDDALRDGTVQNLLVILDSGGRLAAAHGSRSNGVTTLDNAIYSPCPVTTPKGCPKRPSWSITAARVIDDPAHERVLFRGGRLQLFGINLPLLPVFSIGTGSDGITGWLVPEISYSTKKGLELALPYHWQIAPNRDLTVTPHVYSGVYPALEAKYRELNRLGAFQLGGFVTYGTIESANPDALEENEGRGLRAYGEANGKFQLDPLWSITGSLRWASDKTVTRRYDLTRDDRLRNFINAERINTNSYVSIAAWAFQ